MQPAHRTVVLVIGLSFAQHCAAGVSVEEFGGSLALTSDDIFRGISQTCGHPAAQADLHYRGAGGQSAGQAFAGLWGSAGLGATACGKAREFNVFAGYSVQLAADSAATVTYTHYGYPGGAYTIEPLAGYRYDYDALEAQWAWQDQLYLTLAWTPDALRYGYYSVVRDRRALSYGVQWHRPLRDGFSLAAGIGYDEIPDPAGTGYGLWNAGLGYTLGALQVQVGYFGTSRRAERLFGSYVAGNRASVSAVWRF
jgi:uncharacterized protein (TIGR02001 family)